MAYKLSKSGKAKKKKRDLKFAKTTRRTRMKAENQKKRRAAKKKGIKDISENSGNGSPPKNILLDKHKIEDEMADVN